MDFRDLITPYHRSAPKFSQMVKSVTDPVQAQIDLAAGFVEAYDLDKAVGRQLDVIGELVGRSRDIITPVGGLFFSLDKAILGFDEAEWFVQGVSDVGVYKLSDDTYRLLLKAKIACNHWDGTAVGAEAAMQFVFGSSARLWVQDGGMEAFYNFAGALPPTILLVLFSDSYIPLKPAGVKVYYFATSVPNTPIFGFDLNNGYIGGFDTGAFGVDPKTYLS